MSTFYRCDRCKEEANVIDITKPFFLNGRLDCESKRQLCENCNCGLDD